jgi:cytoskeletal protein RodZ
MVSPPRLWSWVKVVARRPEPTSVMTFGDKREGDVTGHKGRTSRTNGSGSQPASQSRERASQPGRGSGASQPASQSVVEPASQDRGGEPASQSVVEPASQPERERSQPASHRAGPPRGAPARPGRGSLAPILQPSSRRGATSPTGPARRGTQPPRGKRGRGVSSARQVGRWAAS